MNSSEVPPSSTLLPAMSSTGRICEFCDVQLESGMFDDHLGSSGHLLKVMALVVPVDRLKELEEKMSNADLQELFQKVQAKFGIELRNQHSKGDLQNTLGSEDLLEEVDNFLSTSRQSSQEMVAEITPFDGEETVKRQSIEIPSSIETHLEDKADIHGTDLNKRRNGQRNKTFKSDARRYHGRQIIDAPLFKRRTRAQASKAGSQTTNAHDTVCIVMICTSIAKKRSLLSFMLFSQLRDLLASAKIIKALNGSDAANDLMKNFNYIRLLSSIRNVWLERFSSYKYSIETDQCFLDSVLNDLENMGKLLGRYTPFVLNPY